MPPGAGVVSVDHINRLHHVERCHPFQMQMLKPSVGAHGLGDVLIVGNPDSCLPTVGVHYLSCTKANQYDVANVIISYFDVIECNINVIMSIHNICM